MLWLRNMRLLLMDQRPLTPNIGDLYNAGDKAQPNCLSFLVLHGDGIHFGNTPQWGGARPHLVGSLRALGAHPMIRNVTAAISELIISMGLFGWVRLADMSPRRQLGRDAIEEIAIDALET